MARKAEKEKVVSRLKPDPPYGKTFIRQWRKHRGLTQEQLAERVEVSHASIGRIERGLQPYGQPLLEAIAFALRCETADLLVRDPLNPDAAWSIWETVRKLKPETQRQALRLVNALAEEEAA